MSNKIKLAEELYQKYRYDEALECVDELLKIDKKNTHLCNLKASILIDSWTRDESSIIRMMMAINYLERLIDSDSANRVIYYYNIANAYSNIANTKLIINKNKLNKDIIKNFENAKENYEKSLKIDDKQPKAWINKGNTLDNIGRYLEAIECYNKAILMDNTHYNAWGNKGLTVRYLSTQVINENDKKLLYHHSMIYLAIEMLLYPNFPIDNKTKQIVNNYITANNIDITPKEFLKEQLPKKLSILDDKFNVCKTNKGDFEIFYFEFCKTHQLFLNTHFYCKECNLATKDLLEVSFIIGISDYKKTYELMNKWHNLLDEYKTARFLLSLSQYRHDEFAFLDKQRYLPDYSLTYIHNVELLKSAFLIVMGIFDKIAFFLNDYEDLKMTDDSIHFWSSDSIFNHKHIVEQNNFEPNLVAIDSVQRDLTYNELSILIELRNYIIHRYLILHDIINVDELTYPYDRSNTPVENKMYHMDIDEFFTLTLLAFKNVRNVLFSLSFFIMNKEKQKKQNFKGVIPTRNWTIDFDKHPELKKVADDLAKTIIDEQDKLKDSVIKALENGTNVEYIIKVLGDNSEIDDIIKALEDGSQKNEN